MISAKPSPSPASIETVATAAYETFKDTKLIRFHHCDPAGIVFYPQYFVLFNEVVEDWFTHGLGISFSDHVMKKRVSVPLVRVECDFVGPSKIGDQLVFSLNVLAIGESSMKIRIVATCGSALRVRATLTLVQASLDALRSVPISDDLRGTLCRYMVQA